MIPNRSALFALAALALPAGLQGQQVSADISIASGPVAGRVIVGDPYYRHPTYRYHPAYREIVVVRGHRGNGWYRNHAYRAVRVYYDADRDCYYDRAYYGGLRAVVVYQNGGRYFSDYDRRDGYRRDDYRRDDYRRDDERNDYRSRVADRSDRRYDDDDRH
jgi:hypothetical protein